MPVYDSLILVGRLGDTEPWPVYTFVYAHVDAHFYAHHPLRTAHAPTCHGSWHSLARARPLRGLARHLYISRPLRGLVCLFIPLLCITRCCVARGRACDIGQLVHE